MSTANSTLAFDKSFISQSEDVQNLDSKIKDIWIFNHHALSPNIPGGTRHFDLAKKMVEKGYNVKIFASSFIHNLNRELKNFGCNNVTIDNIDGVEFVWLRTYPYSRNDWKRVVNMLSYSFRAYMTAKRSLRPDVIIGSSVHLFAAFTAYRLAKHFDTPFIMEVRDLWPLTPIEMGMPKWHPFIILLTIMEKILYDRARKIITLLPKAHQYIESIGVPANKIVWIPNGVDLKNFSPVHNHYQKPDNKFIITYAGAIGEANNLEILLEVAAKLQKDDFNISFVLIGNGPLKETLANEAKKKGLDNITFRDPIPKGEIPTVFNQSDALFMSLKNLPIFKFGISSNKLFEFLAAGKPIIFAVNSGNNPVQESGAGITVSPDDPDGIARAAICLSKMAIDSRRQMGLNGRRYVEKHHSMSFLANKLESTIIEATNRYKEHITPAS